MKSVKGEISDDNIKKGKGEKDKAMGKILAEGERGDLGTHINGGEKRVVGGCFNSQNLQRGSE